MITSHGLRKDGDANMSHSPCLVWPFSILQPHFTAFPSGFLNYNGFISVPPLATRHSHKLLLNLQSPAQGFHPQEYF